MCNLVDAGYDSPNYASLFIEVENMLKAARFTEKFGDRVVMANHPDIFVKEAKAFALPSLPVYIAMNNQICWDFQRWFLIPNRKDIKTEEDEARFRKEYHTFNARCETVSQKGTFAESYEKRQRCVIPIAAFYEWMHTDKEGVPNPGGAVKVRFRIDRSDGQPMYLGGLFADNENLGKRTFTVITTPSNEIMSRIHNSKLRQPLILEKDKVEEFLFTDDLEPFFGVNDSTPLRTVLSIAAPAQKVEKSKADKPKTIDKGLDLF